MFSVNPMIFTYELYKIIRKNSISFQLAILVFLTFIQDFAENEGIAGKKTE